MDGKDTKTGLVLLLAAGVALVLSLGTDDTNQVADFFRVVATVLAIVGLISLILGVVRSSHG